MKRGWNPNQERDLGARLLPTFHPRFTQGQNLDESPALAAKIAFWLRYIGIYTTETPVRQAQIHHKVTFQTDRIQVELRAILFGLEDDMRPTDVMFTYRLIEWVGIVAAYAQRVGRRLQLLLAK